MEPFPYCLMLSLLEVGYSSIHRNTGAVLFQHVENSNVGAIHLILQQKVCQRGNLGAIQNKPEV